MIAQHDEEVEGGEDEDDGGEFDRDADGWNNRIEQEQVWSVVYICILDIYCTATSHVYSVHN